jgi:hypothetical protein
VPEPLFEVSKEGIKLSYSRFLGDSATGLVVELVATLSYYYPIFGKSLKDAVQQPIGTEAKIFLLVLLFLLSTPIGLVLNATGWYLLGGLQVRLQFAFFHRDFWFLRLTKQEFAFEATRTALGITRAKFFEGTELIDHAFELYFPHMVDPLPHVRGVYRLTRSLALLCLGPFCFELWRAMSRFDGACAGRSVLWLSAFAFLLVLSAAAGFFRALSNLQRLYMLMVKHGLLEVPEESLQDYLRQTAVQEAAALARLGAGQSG